MPAYSNLGSRLRVPFAVRLGSAQSEKQDVQVTDDREEKRMMNTNVIGDPTLSNRDNCATDDSHDHYARPISGKGTELCDAKGKDAGKHNRVEEADENDAVHREVS